MHSKKRSAFLVISLLLILVIFAGVFRYVHTHRRQSMRALATSVQVAEVTLKDAPLFVKAQGTVEASRSVAIQAQVTGIIKKIGFTPGQTVKAGQLLFKIDSTTYEAALAKAQANLSKDEAQLQMTQKDSSRYQTLIKKGFISKQQYDQTQAQLNENLSTVKLDKAAIQQNQAELNYTTILAPISGKTGNVTIKEGDLVNASSDKPLVTVNQLSPIYVDFYLCTGQFLLFIKRTHVTSCNSSILGISNARHS